MSPFTMKWCRCVSRLRARGTTTSAEVQSVSDSAERRWLWQAVVENAAASEVAVNVCLPWLICSRSESGWEAPPDLLMGCIVFGLNLFGCFLEGFFKSLRLLSQSLRRSKATHQLVFVTSQSFSAGFLNVITSFPDVADTAGHVVESTHRWYLGCLYLMAHMLGGVVIYKLGRDLGWRFARRSWGVVHLGCDLWMSSTRAIIIIVAFVLIISSMSSSGGAVKGGSQVPLDLSEPNHPGFVVKSAAHESTGGSGGAATMLLSGVAVGIFMSVAGAVVAAFFCDVLFVSKGRPMARFLANLVATILVLVIQPAPAPSPGVSRWDNASFVTLKFVTSFCGALSAFSGTIGDVADAYFGSPSEESTLDGTLRWTSSLSSSLPPQGQFRLPFLGGVQNLLAHGSLLMLVMLLSFSTVTEDAMEQVANSVTPQGPHWVREKEWVTWRAQEIASSPSLHKVDVDHDGAIGEVFRHGY